MAVDSRTRIVRMREESERVRSSERLSGREGLKVFGSRGLSNQFVPPELVGGGVFPGVGLEGERRAGPFSSPKASSIIECSNRSWEEMKEADVRSPVQRVISMQSRDWFSRVRRAVNGGRRSGCLGSEVGDGCGSVRTRGEGWRVFNRRCNVYSNIKSAQS